MCSDKFYAKINNNMHFYITNPIFIRTYVKDHQGHQKSKLESK